MKRRISLASLAIVFTLVTGRVFAGGALPDARKVILGRCPSGESCFENIFTGEARCDPETECRIDATDTFTGELVLAVDEGPCPGRGGRVTMGLAARLRDGTTFSVTPLTFDLCDVDVQTACIDSNHTTPFYCTTDATGFGEAHLPGASWLTLHPLPEGIGEQIRSHFPQGNGTPVIVEAEDCSLAEGSPDPNDGQPVTKRYCVKGHMVQLPVPLTPGCDPGETCLAGTIPPKGGSVVGTTIGADPAGTVNGCVFNQFSLPAPERLFDWQPSKTGVAVIDTCGARTNFDSMVYVRPGACADPAFADAPDLGCNDDADGCGPSDFFGSRLSIRAKKGERYCVVVDGRDGSSGNFDLDIHYCRQKPVVIPPAGGSATVTIGTTSCGFAGSGEAERLFEWTPRISGQAVLSGASTRFSANLTVRNGRCTELGPEVRNYAGGSGWTGGAGFAVMAGDTYCISASGSPGEEVSLTVGFCTLVPGAIPAGGGTVTGTTSVTCNLAGPGSCASSSVVVASEQLFEWTPDRSAIFTVDTCGPGTTFDSAIYVNDGGCFSPALSTDACAQTFTAECQHVPAEVVAGRTYCVVVDGTNEFEEGSFALHVQECAITPHVVPPEGGIVSGNAAVACGLDRSALGEAWQDIFEWTPNRSGAAKLLVDAFSYWTPGSISVRAGGCTGPKVASASYEDVLAFDATAGVTYCMIVSFSKFGGSGPLTLDLTVVAPDPSAALKQPPIPVQSEPEVHAAMTDTGGRSTVSASCDGCCTDPCGDGDTDPGEQCDDGNQLAGDGCDASCRVENTGGWACEPGIARTFCAAQNQSLCPEYGGCCDACCVCSEQVSGPSECARSHCPTAPSEGCIRSVAAEAAALTLKDGTPDSADALVLRLTKLGDTTTGDFGDPTKDDFYDVCLYDASASLVMEARVPSGRTCAEPPCWKSAKGNTELVFSSKSRTPAGISKVTLRPSVAGQGLAAVLGKGSLLGMPPIQSLVPPLRAQLHARTGTCLEATFAKPVTNPNKYQARGE
jgi:cysteine-rich repeat protein